MNLSLLLYIDKKYHINHHKMVTIIVNLKVKIFQAETINKIEKLLPRCLSLKCLYCGGVTSKRQSVPTVECFENAAANRCSIVSASLCLCLCLSVSVSVSVSVSISISISHRLYIFTSVCASLQTQAHSLPYNRKQFSFKHT